MPVQAPPIFTYDEATLVTRALNLCNSSRDLLNKIVSEVTPETATFENVILPIAINDNQAALLNRILGFFQHVSTNSGLRNASSKAEQKMEDYGIEAGMREDIYKLVEAVYKRGEKLDPESQRLLEKERKGYISAGLGIPAGEKRDRFKEIQKRLSRLAIQFSKNLNEGTGGIWFTKEELDGVPDKVLERFEKGTGEREGKMRMTFKYPDYLPVLQHAKKNEMRLTILLEHENNVSITLDICCILLT